jgi:hypothetical protein
MRRKCLPAITDRSWRLLLGAVACISVTLHFGAEAQEASPSIPAFGPDRFTAWHPNRLDGDNYLPPLSGPGPVTSDPAHPYRTNGAGDDAAGMPTYRVADLSNPILRPWAAEEMQAWNDMVLANGKIPFVAAERCYPPGPAWNIFRSIGTPMLFFVQLPEKVVMIYRSGNLDRHVLLNVPHTENPAPSWQGDSVGHYEGDTLVVDTIAFLDHPYSFVDNFRTPHTERLHMVERYRLVDADTMEIEVYVEDPGAFTMPWRARQIFYRTHDEPLEEWRCSEGNPDYFNLYAVPVPEAAAPDF